MTRTDPKQAKARQHAQASKAAAARALAALKAGQPVSLDDAKTLEAAGCWLRRNAVQ